MRHKKSRKRLRSYVFWMICIFLLASMMLDALTSFFIGFFTGFLEIDATYAKQQFGTVSKKIGVAVLILLGGLVYVQVRRRVVKPAEELAEQMEKVSQGDLTVRVPVDGGFEFGQMQESFNFMVEELEKAKQERELQEQRNGQLYAGIAHDLKTPMTMIKGYARLLGEQKSLSEEASKRYLETIVEQTESANNLLDSLLAYTKLQNQSYTMKPEKKDIAEVLRVCVANFYPTLEEAGMQVELYIPEEALICEFDEPEMKRVFMNLLSNMVKHNPQGTVGKICMEQVPDTAEKPTEPMERMGSGACFCGKAACLRCVIADNGSKITDDLQDRLFETFAVGDCSRNTQNGSGLGLAISRKIVEQHGGSLYYVADWQAEYKAFVIELPVG